MTLPTNDDYTKKLEDANQKLEKRNGDLEIENKNLIAKIKELDPNFWESEFKNADIRGILAENAIKDMEEDLKKAQARVEVYARVEAPRVKTKEELEDQEITKAMKNNREYFRIF
jgi:hypothetical protein